MDIREEIGKRVDKLSPEMQEHVLRFVASLGASVHAGETGTALRQFAFSIDAASARQMEQAIEEECERIDAGQW
jgi:hypothetical protein